MSGNRPKPLGKPASYALLFIVFLIPTSVLVIDNSNTKNGFPKNVEKTLSLDADIPEIISLGYLFKYTELAIEADFATDTKYSVTVTFVRSEVEITDQNYFPGMGDRFYLTEQRNPLVKGFELNYTGYYYLVFLAPDYRVEDMQIELKIDYTHSPYFFVRFGFIISFLLIYSVAVYIVNMRIKHYRMKKWRDELIRKNEIEYI